MHSASTLRAIALLGLLVVGARVLGEAPPLSEIASDQPMSEAPEQDPAPPVPWTMVVLPDTQHYSESPDHIHHLEGQLLWLQANLLGQTDAVPNPKPNIRFVSHVGDVVQHGGTPEEWDRATAALNLLDGDPARHPQALVPYSVVMGNHDYDLLNDRDAGSKGYRTHFSRARYRDRPDGRSYAWYGGSSPDGLSHWQRFSAGGFDFLHLALSWEIEGAPELASTPLGWARAVLDAHPDTPSIISTHAYIWDLPGSQGRTQSPQSIGGSSGEDIFRHLVQPSPQVFMVLGGHWHLGSGAEDGEWHQVSQNAAGLDVFEILADFQDYPEGGEGWLRTIDFLPGEGDAGPGRPDRIQVQTYSPTLLGGLGSFQRDATSEFSWDLDFQARFGSQIGGRTAAPLPLSLVEQREAWHYRYAEALPPEGWEAPGFDAGAAGWAEGPGPLGYGDPDIETDISAGLEPGLLPLRAQLRHRFEVPPGLQERYDALTLSLYRDDGALVFLNGRAVFSSNLALPLGPETPAERPVDWSEERRPQSVGLDPALLKPGENVLAVDLRQSAVDSSDMALDLALVASRLDAGFRLSGQPEQSAGTGFEEGAAGDMAHWRRAASGEIAWQAGYSQPRRSSAFAGITGAFLVPERPRSRHQLMLRDTGIWLLTERLDLRGIPWPQASLGFRSYEDNDATDFELEDQVEIGLYLSSDGRYFERRPFFEARGSISEPARDALKRYDRGRLGSFSRVNSPPGFIPPEIKSLQLYLEAVTDSDSERLFFDDIRVGPGPSPSPTPSPTWDPRTPSPTVTPKPDPSATPPPPTPFVDEVRGRVFMPWVGG